ncbi:MAG: sugar phosphate isomerase/epimerase family protein [Verrucomicrobiota bacterium]
MKEEGSVREGRKNGGMGRRRFMRVSAGAAGAGIFGGMTPWVQAGDFSGKIKKAVKFHMVDDSMSVMDRFRLIKDLGFDGTEVRVGDDIDAKAIVKAVNVVGLPVHGVVNSANPDIKNAIDLAKLYGGSSVLVVCRYDKSLSMDDNWSRDVENIRAAAPYAETHGIDILVENVWASYLISAWDVQRFVDACESPVVGAYFDVGNNVRWGVAHHWIPVLGDRIVKLDIKEYDTDKQVKEGLRAGFDTKIGEGSVNWEAVRGELAGIGFEGWATAEVTGGGRERLQDIADRMDRVLAL